MTSKSVTIFHNPNCSTSRKVLAFLRDSGAEVQVVDYMKTGWTRDVLDDLLHRMHAEPRAILRAKEALAKDLGLDRPDTSAETILKAMIAHPILVDRPIVSGPRGAALCRPAEVVETLI